MYDFGNSIVQVTDANLEMTGPGPAQATINSSASFAAAVRVNAANVTISGMRITQTGTAPGIVFDVPAAGSSGARLSVTTSGNGTAARQFAATGATTLSDSVCRYTSASGFGGILVSNGSPALQNVTAAGTAGLSAGLFARPVPTADVAVNARNSIFFSPGGDDIGAQNLAVDDEATIDLDFSNYADTSEDDGNADTTITGEGTLGNVAALPVFTDRGGLQPGPRVADHRQGLGGVRNDRAQHRGRRAHRRGCARHRRGRVRPCAAERRRDHDDFGGRGPDRDRPARCGAEEVQEEEGAPSRPMQEEGEEAPGLDELGAAAGAPAGFELF